LTPVAVSISARKSRPKGGFFWAKSAAVTVDQITQRYGWINRSLRIHFHNLKVNFFKLFARRLF